MERCLATLKESVLDLSWEVLIVNNDKEELPTHLDIGNVKIIHNGSNDGFSRACNIGAKNSSGEILFFLNPDTEILTANISRIKIFFSLHLDVAIISPQLIGADGHVQPWSVGFEITLWDIIRNNFGFIKSKKLWGSASDVSVCWVSGAALAIRKSSFDQISGYDENFFMYFEDVDLCKRISELNKKIFLLPDIKVLHFGGKSSSDRKEQKGDYYSSQDYYFKKHFGDFQLFILKILRWVSFILKR